MLTDVDAVFYDWGEPEQAAIGQITPEALEKLQFPAGSIGPKVTAAREFVRAGGRLAGLARLGDACAIVKGLVGAVVQLENGGSASRGLDMSAVCPAAP